MLAWHSHLSKQVYTQCVSCAACGQAVDEETHKAMLAWHFKKQEQQKARCTAAMPGRRSLCYVGCGLAARQSSTPQPAKTSYDYMCTCPLLGSMHSCSELLGTR